MKNKNISKDRIKNEIDHFTELEHIWWGARTKAGQKRYDYKLEKLKEFCKPKKDYKILEIGCGDGEFTKRLAKLHCKIIATDITPEVIKRAKKNIKNNNLKFEVDNAEKTKFEKNSLDIICGISILHHINYQKALKEMARILKPGGQLFFTEPNLVNPIIYAGLNVPFLRKNMEFSPDEVALVRWNIESLLEKTGFSEFKVVNYDFLFPKTPPTLIGLTKSISSILEKIPLAKELSGSLIVWAKK